MADKITERGQCSTPSFVARLPNWAGTFFHSLHCSAAIVARRQGSPLRARLFYIVKRQRVARGKRYGAPIFRFHVSAGLSPVFLRHPEIPPNIVMFDPFPVCFPTGILQPNGSVTGYVCNRGPPRCRRFPPAATCSHDNSCGQHHPCGPARESQRLSLSRRRQACLKTLRLTPQRIAPLF